MATANLFEMPDRTSNFGQVSLHIPVRTFAEQSPGYVAVEAQQAQIIGESKFDNLTPPMPTASSARIAATSTVDVVEVHELGGGFATTDTLPAVMSQDDCPTLAPIGYGFSSQSFAVEITPSLLFIFAGGAHLTAFDDRVSTGAAFESCPSLSRISPATLSTRHTNRAVDSWPFATRVAQPACFQPDYSQSVQFNHSRFIVGIADTFRHVHDCIALNKLQVELMMA